PPIVQARPTPAVAATATAPPPTAAASPAAVATARPEPPANDGSGLSQLYDRGTSGRMQVALTFDAGADRGKAAQILDILAKRGVKASFGITGHWAVENPDLVKRMAADGHMIFNHTWTHRSYTGYSTSPGESVIDTAERIKEITDSADEIKSLTGYETAPYFRPPYGDYDDSSLTDVAAAGYWVSVMWTCDSLGWNWASTDQIIERCGAEGSKGAVPGGIILMHVGAASLDAEALPGLIDALEGQGFALVTVEQLLQP
ncbi:MAG: polysaccharide deacetylase family protein, partial [Thermomicrobiales bacterium]